MSITQAVPGPQGVSALLVRAIQFFRNFGVSDKAGILGTAGKIRTLSAM
jgi:hypothetical protein